jgi:hypothetical protein
MVPYTNTTGIFSAVAAGTSSVTVKKYSGMYLQMQHLADNRATSYN